MEQGLGMKASYFLCPFLVGILISRAWLAQLARWRSAMCST